MISSLRTLFKPRGVAVVGVSSDPTKLGTVIFNNIFQAKFKGGVYPVNPKYEEVFGLKCYPSVAKIKGDVDIAVIVVPSQFVLPVLKECAKKKVGNVVIISAGFKEVGPEGAKLEKFMVSYARKNGIRVVGPNCLGLIFTDVNLNASFASQNAKEGPAAFLSQSGAFNTAMLDIAQNKNLGFKYFVSLGNKADLNELDLFKEWLGDDSVKVIGTYIEEFADGKKLIEMVQNENPKPIVMLHSGQSEAGRKAAASHTGSLASSAVTVQSALKQANIIQVDTIEKMFGDLMMFSWSPKPTGNRVALITNAGGPGIIITDMLAAAGLQLAELSSQTKRSLQKVLPENASVNNPVDLLGDALATRYKDALSIISEDPGVDSILVLLTPQLVTQIEETSKLIINFVRTARKPIVPLFIGDKFVMPGLQRLWDNNVPAYQYAEEAIHALNSITTYSLSLNERSKFIKLRARKPRYYSKVNKQTSTELIALPGDTVQLLCGEVELDVPEESVVTTIDKAVEFADEVGYPVVIKATTEDVIHKSDQKLVYLNIKNEKELATAFNKLSKSITYITDKINPNILIQEMVRSKEELIIGMKKDALFGYVLLFGKGGIYTEVYNDVSTRIMNINREEIKKMINETKVSRVLNGIRGQKKLAVEALIDTVEKLQALVNLYPQIESIDINPAMINAERCVSVDVKIFIKRS